MLKPNQIPIVIGGGHNNALPLLRWAHAQRKVVQNLNFDAHFDCRKPGLRHSGNAFSTAILEGILQKYSVLGIDTYAMNDYIRTFVNEYHVSFVPHIEYLQGRGVLEDVAKLISPNSPIGLDIDVDCIENMP
ncbi:MAG: arginase family protein, partial [Bacteroidota bacterium]